MLSDQSILLVEDNEADIFLFKEYIHESCNISITVATDLSTAIKHLHERHFSLIMLDLNLPDSYGIATLEQIIENKTHEAVVVMTGLYDEELGIKAVQMGTQDFVVKNSINPEVLLRIINYAISRNKDQIQLSHLNKLLKASRDINQLITRLDDPNRLINKACKMLVGSKVYSAAWIILTNKNLEAIEIANAGFEPIMVEEFYQNFKKDKHPGCIQKAIVTNKHIVSCKIEPDCTDCPIAKRKQKNAAFINKLNYKNDILGFIGVLIAPEYANNIDEIELFKEICSDISFSLFTIKQTLEKKNAEDIVRKQTEEIIKQNHEYETLNEAYINTNKDLQKSNKHLKVVNTELKEAKELAEQNEKLKTAFMCNMSHEIRTPMNAIIGFSNFLADDSLEPSKRDEFIQHIKNAGKRLLQIINDIIDISKIEANQLQIHTEKCNLYSIIKSSYESFLQSETLKEKPELFLLPNIPPDLSSLFIKTDTTRLNQVLDNLLSNAIKYTHKGFIEFGFNLTGIKNREWIRFYVKDTGIGIPQDKQELVFERFRQVEELEYHEGAGIGLSIAKGIVELLGGSIWFDSEIGKGSTFYFTIPYEPLLKEQATNNTEDIDINLNGVKILIAEDDKSCYLYLKQILSGTNAELTHVNNGSECLQLIHTVLPDIILLDINMPVMNGFQFLEELRNMRINHDFKIIAQTANAMVDEKTRCLEEGCHDYIAKPYTKEDLLYKITALLTTKKRTSIA